MEIVGRGFLARNLEPLASAHPGVVAFARGVSSGQAASSSEFARDADRLYESLRECRASGRRFLYFSTSSAGLYGSPGQGSEDGPVFPSSAYGRHKLAMESVIAAADVDHLIIRLAHPVGFHQPAHQLVPKLVSQVMSGTISVHRGAKRDLIDVRHLVEIVDLLLARGVRRETVNVASGYSVPVEDIVEHVEKALGTKADREWVDAPDDHHISLDKLRRLVPEVARMGFGPGYYRAALDRYVGGEMH